MHIYIYMYIYMYICRNIYICIYIYVYIYICIYIYVYIYVYMCMYIYICVCFMRVYVYVYIYIYMCVCLHGSTILYHMSRFCKISQFSRRSIPSQRRHIRFPENAAAKSLALRKTSGRNRGPPVEKLSLWSLTTQ